MSHNLKDYYYNLPPELIATAPAEPRDSSKLLVYKKSTNELTEDRFYNIKKYLPAKTVLVFNNSKVFKARLKFEYNSKHVEVFFAEKKSDSEYLVLVKPGKLFKLDSVVSLPGNYSLKVKEIFEDGSRMIEVLESDFDLYSYLEQYGDTPLPPYIKVDDANSFTDRYQTVYAKDYGSVAAPTAGLHFTESLIAELKQSGVEFLEVTLNVGLGTFKSVKTENIKDHLMHSESFEMTPSTAEKLNELRTNGYAIVPVGTTSIRVLQSCFNFESNKFVANTGDTDIFIYPGFDKWIISGMVTNFHLPESTLIMLVSAYLGIDKTLELYEYAVANKFRFYSFGDACLFLD
jgi:S-adenosylmethionine:tRNA ribosyltransferase-isomerase